MNLFYRLERLAINHYRNKFLCKTKKNMPVSPPTYVLWDCTRRCNLQCVHCGASKEKYANELSTDEILHVIDDLAKMKVNMFAVTGGEPLLRNDLFEILCHASKKGIVTGIASNGFLITKDVAAKIKDIGVSSIQISIDGTKETHNKIRNSPSSFDKAVSAITYLIEAKIPLIQVATTITTSNISELDEIKQLLLKLKVKHWRIGIIMPIGRATDKDLMLDAEQLKWLLDFVKQNKHVLNISIGENLPYLLEYEESIRDGPVLCPVGITACCIGVDGNVRGCPEQPDTQEFIEGNIKEKSITSIWQNGFKRYRLNTILKEDHVCSVCKDKYKCFGGCWVMRKGNTHCIHNLINKKL